MIMTIILRENEWTPEACEKFTDLTHVAQWKPLIAKIKGYKYPMPIPDSNLSDSPIPCIELYEKNGDKVRKENKFFFPKIYSILFNFFQVDSFIVF